LGENQTLKNEIQDLLSKLDTTSNVKTETQDNYDPRNEIKEFVFQRENLQNRLRVEKQQNEDLALKVQEL
jgi:hypothetical protein